MEDKEIREFADKIKEAIIKLQKTLPKQLEEEDIKAISELIYEYVSYKMETKGGINTDLSGLIETAIFEANEDEIIFNPDIYDKIKKFLDKSRLIINSSKVLSDPEEEKLDENIPYLDIFISDRFLGIENHRNQCLYSSNDEYETTKSYFVKSHAQAVRDYLERGEIGENDKEPAE